MRADISNAYDMKDASGEDVSTVSYSYFDPSSGEQLNRTVSYEYATSWNDILSDFINFLSCVYGYDIRNKVDIKHNTFSDDIEVDFN